MKVASVTMAVMLVFGGMMVVGAFVPELDPAPTAEAHGIQCSNDQSTADYAVCVAGCAVHQLFPGHFCAIEPPCQDGDEACPF